jgi:aryl-alcohol dehydrogenase-like predicted oxidoreductase
LYTLDKLILGTVQMGIPYGINNHSGKPDSETSFEILDLAYVNGIRMLDTAESYGNSHQVIGDYHRNHSTNLFNVITKLAPNSSDGDIRMHVEKDLKELNLNKLGGYMFHSFQSFRNSHSGAETLSCLRNEGLIDKWGVSVYTNDELEFVINETDMDLVQLPFNVLDNRKQRGLLLKAASKKGMEIHVRSIFLQGLFFMNPEQLPEKLTPLKPYFLQLNALIRQAGNTMQDVCMAYALAQPEINKILIGVDTPVQLKHNLDSIIGSKVDAGLLQEISEIDVQQTALLNPVNWK